MKCGNEKLFMVSIIESDERAHIFRCEFKTNLVNLQKLGIQNEKV